MTELITINITAEERDELLNALYCYTASPNLKLTDQEMGVSVRLLNMLELTADDEETEEPEKT